MVSFFGLGAMLLLQLCRPLSGAVTSSKSPASPQMAMRLQLCRPLSGAVTEAGWRLLVAGG